MRQRRVVAHPVVAEPALHRLGAERVEAVQLRGVAGGELDARGVLAAARGELDEAGITPDYLELRSMRDLSPVERVNGATLLAVAARVGGARLIDNTILQGGTA